MNRLPLLPALILVGLLAFLSVFPSTTHAQSPPTQYKHCLNIDQGQNATSTDIPLTDPPLPRIVIQPTGSTEYRPNFVSTTHDYSVIIVPDPEFQRNFPHDAQYSFSSIALLVQRGSGAPTRIGNFRKQPSNLHSIIIPLSQFKDELKSGDQLWLKLSTIYRINYQQKKVKVPFPDLELYIPLVLE